MNIINYLLVALRKFIVTVRFKAALLPLKRRLIAIETIIRKTQLSDPKEIHYLLSIAKQVDNELAALKFYYSAKMKQIT